MNRSPIYFVVSALARCSTTNAYGHVVAAVLTSSPVQAVGKAQPLMQSTFDPAWSLSLTAVPLLDELLSFAFVQSRLFFCSVAASHGHEQPAHLAYAVHARKSHSASISATAVAYERWSHATHTSVAVLEVALDGAIDGHCSPVVWHRKPIAYVPASELPPSSISPPSVVRRPLLARLRPWRAYFKDFG